MAVEYSVEACRQLARRFEQARLERPRRIERYDAGEQLTREMTGVWPRWRANVTVEIERFVGGGFAGQVYRVRIVRIEAMDGIPCGLDEGDFCAMKVLVPPSAGSRRFRDLIYAIGFQSPFSLQVNPDASRSGALWQKFIRRAAALRFGTPQSVVDIHATFVDPHLGSCGEISEWVDGRTWRYEVDDNLIARRRWKPGMPDEGLNSPEYRAKRQYMADFVRLLHDVGAYEFARQYEWWTCKSQPNALKRRHAEDDPAEGLTAVDFRAGLALLPFLPMSPGDVPLIGRGLARGSLVQFDRGDVQKLAAFVAANEEAFADMRPALDDLRACEKRYRESMPDVTHNHVRLLRPARWGTILRAQADAWRIQNTVDDDHARRLAASPARALLFALAALAGRASVLTGLVLLVMTILRLWRGEGVNWPLTVAGLVGLLVVAPTAIRVARLAWGRVDMRRHYARLLTNVRYFWRALRGKAAEAAISWHRAGRLSEPKARCVGHSPARFLLHLPLSVLPVGLHRMLTDWQRLRATLRAIFVRPIVLYVNPAEREQWLRDMVDQGRRQHMLTDADAKEILAQLDEPFIQKYLKSLAVHVCTLPITQVVSVAVAIGYVLSKGLTWDEAVVPVAAILAAFQVVPISPGSLVRGLYVLGVVVKERNLRDYKIALVLSFFKYIGYLAFPIQMAYRFPVLARFMAGHWATGAVHVVPVFGERGALLEHWVFDTFYNYPLTLRRLLPIRHAQRASRPVRHWHAPALAAVAAALLTAGAGWAWSRWDAVPTLRNLWAPAAGLPVLLGVLTAAWAGGMGVRKRIGLGALAGAAMGLLFGPVHLLLATWGPATVTVGYALQMLSYPVFVFTILATIGAMLEELHLPRRIALHNEPQPAPTPGPEDLVASR